MPKGKSSPKVDEALNNIMDMSYEKLQFEEWCGKFVAKWNSLPKASQKTVRDCTENDFIESIYKSQNVPSPGVAPVSFNSPEEAAVLVMDYALSCS